jgi:RNase H-like domain found in reverse transcriptase/Reverse transcriptase (RNA-dependent DNA polymerase)
MWRPCGDYCRLNMVTRPDRYLHGCRYFSVVNLVKDYHQIPMARSNIAKTVILMPFVLYEYVYMPFGLRNAAKTFQQLIDRVFCHLPFCFCYLDDHLIASRTLEEHLQHLGTYFQLLQDNGLQINPAKCVFAVAEVDILGHSVSAAGILLLPKHVEALQRLPVPTNMKGLQRFLGLINFYHPFLPDSIRGLPRHLTVTAEMTAAVAAAKDALVAATGLAHPLPHAQLTLGVVLQQREGAAWRPLSFFLQKLLPAQSRYSTFDRELTAVFSALLHFRFMLEGRQFHVMTDHKPLVAAFGQVLPLWSARQQCQLAYITEYTTDIRHTPGASNAVADALSRPGPGLAPSPPPPQVAAPAMHTTSPPSASPSAASSPTPAAANTLTTAKPFIAAIPDLAPFAAAQCTCPKVGLMRQSPSLDIVCRLVGTEYLFGDASTPLFRPLVLLLFCRNIFDSLHAGCTGYTSPHLLPFCLAQYGTAGQ